MADPRNIEVVAKDKESETTNGADNKVEPLLAWTTTTIRPIVRDSGNRAKEQMMKWQEQNNSTELLSKILITCV